MDNSIDLGKIYGIDQCPDTGCVPTGVINPNIPSLEQIAEFNLSNAARRQQETQGATQNISPQQDTTPQQGMFQSAQQQDTTPQQGMFQSVQQQDTTPQQGMFQSAQQPQTNSGLSVQNVPQAPEFQNLLTPAAIGGIYSGPLPPAQPSFSSPSELGKSTTTITQFSRAYPVTSESIQFLNGFIRTQIGRRARIEFLVGGQNMVIKDGYLLGVGANYLLINEIGTKSITACDFYNLKFIMFYY